MKKCGQDIGAIYIGELIVNISSSHNTDGTCAPTPVGEVQTVDLPKATPAACLPANVSESRQRNVGGAGFGNIAPPGAE